MRDALQFRNLWQNVGGVADGFGKGLCLAFGQLQRQPMDGWADRRKIAKLAMPELRRDAANAINRLEDEAADRGWRSRARRSRADEVAQSILNLLFTIGDQLLLGRGLVLDGLLGDFRGARDLAD